MKKILVVGLFFGGLYLTERFSHKRTAGFSILRITSNLPSDRRWDTKTSAADEAHLREILAQPFTFLGKGAQCYAFASQDGQYVIKFFKVSHLEAPYWVRHLPLPVAWESWRKAKISYKEDKRTKDFVSYQLAYNALKEETGLIYLHLNKTDHLKQKVALIDKLGIAHQVDLDQLEFMVQRKAEPFYATFEEMIAQGKIAEAKSTLTQLIHILQKRRASGLSDKDPDLETNFGVIGTMPVQIDVGRFKTDELAKKNEPFREEVLRITDDFQKWLKQRQPELAAHLEREIEAIPHNLFPENHAL